MGGGRVHLSGVFYPRGPEVRGRDRIEKIIFVVADRTAADDAVVGCTEGGQSYWEWSQESQHLVRLCWGGEGGWRRGKEGWRVGGVCEVGVRVRVW